TDDGVLVALIRSHVSRDDLACGDADAGRAFGYLLDEPARHRPRSRKRIVGGPLEPNRRPKYRQRRVAPELVDQPMVAVHFIAKHPEEPVQQIHHLNRWFALHQLRRADDVNEKYCDITFFATEFQLFAFGRGRDFPSDVPSEQIAYPLALAQPVDHRVEPSLQLAQLRAVEHHKIAVQVAILDAFQRRPHYPHGRGGEPRDDQHENETEDKRNNAEDQYGDPELRLGQIPQRQREKRGQHYADDRDGRTQPPIRSCPGP